MIARGTRRQLRSPLPCKSYPKKIEVFFCDKKSQKNRKFSPNELDLWMIYGSGCFMKEIALRNYMLHLAKEIHTNCTKKLYSVFLHRKNLKTFMKVVLSQKIYMTVKLLVE